MILTTTLLFATLCLSATDSIHLKDVQVLTLHDGRMTTGRRSAPVAQLECVAGAACRQSPQLRPRVVQCYNKGFDGAEYQWKCEADLDASVRLGSVAVTCEGYTRKGDHEVLRGSCGLEYALEYTSLAPKQQPQPQPQQKTTTTTTTTSTTKPVSPQQDSVVIYAILTILMLLVAVWGIGECFCPLGRSPPPRYTTVSSSRSDLRPRGHDDDTGVVMRSRTKPTAPQPTTTVVNSTPTPVVIVQTPPQPLHNDYYRPSYTDGYLAASLQANRWSTTPDYASTTTTTTTTTTVDTPSPVGESSVSASYGGTKSRGDDSPPNYDTWFKHSSDDTHKSTSYGGKKSR